MRYSNNLKTPILGAVVACLVLLFQMSIAPHAHAASSGMLQFSQAEYVTSESAGTVTLEIERVGGSVGEITATIQTHDGSATIVDDYAGIPTPLTLTWSDGNASPKTVTLPIKPDAVVEGDETFTMDIVSAHAGTPSTATVTILGTSPGTLQFTSPMFEVNEADGTVEVQLERVGGTTGVAKAFIATSDGTAVAVDDYTEIPTLSPVELIWPAGDGSTKTVTIPITTDAIDELDETFSVEILTTVGAAEGAPDVATVAIVELPVVSPSPTPDPGPTPAPSPSPTPTPAPVLPPTGTVEFAAFGYTATEAQCTVAVELQRVGGSHGAVTAAVATNAGSAVGGDDYVPIMAFNPVQVTWADGDTTSKTVLVKLIDDGLSEPDETFNVVLMETVGAGQGTDATTIVITESPVAGTKPVNGCAGDTTADTKDQVAVSTKNSGSAKLLSSPGVPSTDVAVVASDTAPFDGLLPLFLVIGAVGAGVAVRLRSANA